MTPSNHPPSCRTCQGTGWQPGPPIPTIADGVKFAYTTVEPCSNDWYTDDPTVDDHGLDTTTPITFAEYMTRLIARLDKGDRSAELEWAGWETWGAKR